MSAAMMSLMLHVAAAHGVVPRTSASSSHRWVLRMGTPDGYIGVTEHGQRSTQFSHGSTV